MQKAPYYAATVVGLAILSAARADSFNLLTGVDAGRYPGAAHVVVPIPGPGFPGTFYDGDRLAGSGDTGSVITYQGIDTPLFQPNQFGAMSFLFRRGSVPVGGPYRVPIMGIEFLGGPLLDLDGDLHGGARHLTPVVGASPVEIPGANSHLDLSIDIAHGAISITDIDITGTNEGGPGLQPEIATTVTTMAGTTPTGGHTGPVNPAFDTRTGTLTAFSGESRNLLGVYRIDGLNIELWHDSIDPNSASANVLGTFQHFASFGGWLIQRDPQTGQFPPLAGQNLGDTMWPAVDMSCLYQTYQTANNLAGGTATIRDGVSADVFTSTPNGRALVSYGGDLGAYLDAVVTPRISARSTAFIYLESTGFGINNSGDPVFTDTTAYDAVIIAEQNPPIPGDLNGDGIIDTQDRQLLISVLLDPASQPPSVVARADLNADHVADGDDIQVFLDITH